MLQLSYHLILSGFIPAWRALKYDIYLWIIIRNYYISGKSNANRWKIMLEYNMIHQNANSFNTDVWNTLARTCTRLRCFIRCIYFIMIIHHCQYLSASYPIIFVPSLSWKRGALKLIRPSVCPSVCHKNFNLAHILWSINDRALIFGMHDHYDKPFLLVPCRALDLSPMLR